jgi:translocation and assembly module TamB
MRLLARSRASGKWLRRTATLAFIVCASLLFLGLALLGALRLQPVRTFAVVQVNRALDGLFLGKLDIESVARIGPTGAGGVNATMYDADRRAVLIVRGASAQLAVFPLLWAIVVHPRDPISIDLTRVTVDHAEVRLIDAGHGMPTLGVAFYPPHPSSSANSPAIPTIHIRSIAIGHAWVHGRLDSAPAIDADIGPTSAKLEIVAARLRLQIDRAGVHARGLPNGIDVAGETGGLMDLPIAVQSPAGSGKGASQPNPGPVVHAWYNGQLAGSRIAARFDWIDGKLAASLDSPRIEPSSVTRVTPGILLRHPLMLHATAQGVLADVRFEARASVDEARTGTPPSEPDSTALIIIGRAALGEDVQLDAELRAKDVNLADLRVNAPESRLDGVAHLQVTRTSRATITGRYDLSTWPGLVSGTQLPAVDLEGSLSQDPAGAFTTNGHAHILEPGAATTVQYSARLVSKSKDSVVSIESSTEFSNPERLRTLADGLLAQGSIDVSARFWPDDGHWHAQSHAWLRNVQHAQFGAGGIDVLAEVAGGQKASAGSVHVRARDITTVGQTFRNLDLVADGTLTRIILAAHFEHDDAQQFNLTTELGLEPTLHAYHTHIALPSSKDAIAISIDDIHSSGGATHIDGLHLQGAGTADASLTIGRELEELDLSTQSFDWARTARLLGFPLPIRSGQSTLVARYASHGAEGFVHGHASRIDFGPYHDASADVNLTVSQGLVNGTLAAQLAMGNSLNVSVQALPTNRIDRPDLALDSRDFSLSVRAALDIAALRSWIRTFDVPLGHASGTILLELTARGPSAGRENPEILARVETRALQLAGLSDAPAPIENTALARSAQPWSLRGVDGKFALSVSGDRPIAVSSAELFDSRGTLVEARASAELPVSAWRTLHLSSSEALTMPMVASLHMPRRSLQHLPPIAGVQGLRGMASLDVALNGPLDNPQFVVDGAIERLVASIGHRPDKKTPDFDVSVHANGSRYEGKVRADANEQHRTVGSLEANWNGDIARLALASRDDPSPLRGDLVAHLDRLPLERLPAFRNYQMSGVLTGNLALRDWGHDAHLVAKFLAEKLQIGRVVVDRGEITANAADGRLLASVRLAGPASGTLEADVSTKMSWGDRIAPTVDPGIHGRLRAKDLQLGVVSPFLSGSVNELAGSIDAKLDISLDKGIPRLEGQAMLSQGVIQIPSIGQRFDSIRALATVHDGTLSVDNVQARGLTGRVTGGAKIKLDRLSPTSGDMHLAVARNEPIPITVEGQAMGDAWGRVDVKLNRQEGKNTTDIRVDVPELHFDLPDIDPKSLQTLDLAEHVRIGTHLSDGQFIFLPVQPLATEAQGGGEALMVEVHLGNSVWIQKGPGIRVQLAGNLLARIAGKTTLEGRLDLRGGRLDVSGKTFEIERGVVVFNGGDASNPSINARARWDSPAGYSVYAEYAGTVNDGKLTLRSEPTLTSDRVVNLLMFGTPDGAFGASGPQSQGGQSTSAAVGFAGDTAVKGLNKAVSGVTNLDVSARLDTSTGTARPELDVQLTPRVTARMTRAIGEPAVGQSPDRTFLTLELRLLRSWSLSAVVGDHGGSGLDLLWRRRY